ncbi:MAG: PQQ-binding-like beta-propeller repeat protein, partial [Spirochaetia bacterium]
MGLRSVLAAFFALCVLGQAAWPQSAAYLWRAATGGQIRSRPAVGSDGTTYALSEDSFLYAWVSGGSL